MDRKITGLSVLGFQFSDDGQSVGQSISRGTKKPFGFAQGEQRDKVIEEIEELKEGLIYTLKKLF